MAPAGVPTLPEITAVSVRSPYAPTEIKKEYLPKVGRGDDFRWVTGQLFYIHVHADQGLWVVRYAPLDTEDRYGGSVVLAPATSMDAFREGDLVTVHGEVLDEGRASRFLGGPLYRAAAVNLDRRPPQ
jgi:hypothetical protein